MPLCATCTQQGHSGSYAHLIHVACSPDVLIVVVRHTHTPFCRLPSCSSFLNCLLVFSCMCGQLCFVPWFTKHAVTCTPCALCRFAITVANRIARLAILCSHAIEWQEHVFACGGGRHWGSSTASRRAALDLLKYLVAPHLIFLNHINFWVPFRCV